MSIGIELRDEYISNHLFSYEASIISSRRNLFIYTAIEA